MPIPGTWDDPKKKLTDDPGALPQAGTSLPAIVITNVLVNVTGDDTATITWTTSQAGSSRVGYGVATQGLNQTTGETNTSPLVTSHSVTLTGLSGGQMYLFRVYSRLAGGRDGMGNSVMDGYQFTGDGVFATPTGNILLEGGGYVLQEDGTKISTETST